MLEADVMYEYRQIQAFEYEKKTGKPLPAQEEMHDDSYEAWQEKIGLTKDAIEAAKNNVRK